MSTGPRDFFTGFLFPLFKIPLWNIKERRGIRRGAGETYQGEKYPHKSKKVNRRLKKYKKVFKFFSKKGNI